MILLSRELFFCRQSFFMHSKRRHWHNWSGFSVFTVTHSDPHTHTHTPSPQQYLGLNWTSSKHLVNFRGPLVSAVRQKLGHTINDKRAKDWEDGAQRNVSTAGREDGITLCGGVGGWMNGGAREKEKDRWKESEQRRKVQNHESVTTFTPGLLNYPDGKYRLIPATWTLAPPSPTGTRCAIKHEAQISPDRSFSDRHRWL